METRAQQTRKPRQLLAGTRVLDLTTVLAGPFCGYQLALQGADVIKVEVPETGDLARNLGASAELNARQMGASFLAQNAGKRSITINLKSEQGREVFKRLVDSADVVLENFRPGVMERLGLGYEQLNVRRPELIYCAISGFGQRGPMRDKPAYDQIIQGLSGVMSVTGDSRIAPLRVGYPICDTVGGMTAAFAVCAALVSRGATGKGQFIDVSMLDATLVTMGWVISNWLIAESTPRPMGNDNMTASPSGTFKTADGLLNIAANRQEQFESLCHACDRSDLITDERFTGREARKLNRQALTAELEEALKARPAAEWERILDQVSVPAGRVLSVPEALELEQIRSRELLQSFQLHGIPKPVQVVRAGFKLSDAEVGVEMPPPRLGQHTSEILSSLGYSASHINSLSVAGVV